MSLQSQAPTVEIYEFKRLHLIAYILEEGPGPALKLQQPHEIVQPGSRVAQSFHWKRTWRCWPTTAERVFSGHMQYFV